MREHSVDLYSNAFSAQTIHLNESDYYVRTGGQKSAPVALLLHGHTQSGDMWASLADELVKQGYFVVVPDLKGLGKSRSVTGGYTKKEVAEDIVALLHFLQVSETTSIIAHDLGVMIAYPFIKLSKLRIDSAILMEATVPGIGIWRDLLADVDRTWHFGFHGPFAETILEGKEDIYLQRFWEEFSFQKKFLSSAQRERYVSYYRRPGGIRSALSYFGAFKQDAIDNQKFAEQKFDVPILAIGGEYSLGKLIGEHMELLSTDVESAIIPEAGHWLIEENKTATSNLILQRTRITSI
ncbi:MAG: alpha/beta hydrolase [Pseudomonadota bacterium]